MSDQTPKFECATCDSWRHTVPCGRADCQFGPIADLKKDQDDWRKGVALIASALGDPGENLSCVRLAEIALTLRARLEDGPSSFPWVDATVAHARLLTASDAKCMGLETEVATLTARCEALEQALAELVAAGAYAVSCADDVRVMLRLGAATDAARALLGRE